MTIKTTHSLEQVEALMWKESDILKDPNVGKEAKNKARKRLKLLEKHFHDCNGKEFNGKKYPVKVVPKDIPKKELLALIDSVETPVLEPFEKHVYEIPGPNGLDVSGVSVGSNRFTFKE